MTIRFHFREIWCHFVSLRNCRSSGRSAFTYTLWHWPGHWTQQTSFLASQKKNTNMFRPVTLYDHFSISSVKVSATLKPLLSKTLLYKVSKSINTNNKVATKCPTLWFILLSHLEIECMTRELFVSPSIRPTRSQKFVKNISHLFTVNDTLNYSKKFHAKQNHLRQYRWLTLTLWIFRLCKRCYPDRVLT